MTDHDPPFDFSDMSIDAESVSVDRRLITDEIEHKAREMMEQRSEKHVQRVMDQAEHRSVVGEVDAEMVYELSSHLSASGFDVTDDEGQSLIVAYGHPKLTAKLHGEVEYNRMQDTEADPSFSVASVKVLADPTIPENTLLGVHADAAIPTRPTDTRPWIVRHPDGVAVVEVLQR